MRWILKDMQPAYKPQLNEERVRIKFLLFPKRLLNLVTLKYERRWLEMARIKQKYDVNGMYLCDGGGCNTYGWVNVGFVE